MNADDQEKAEERAHVALMARAIRDIRKRRNMKPSEVAAAMGMAIRTYEHFEAGTGRITYSRIRRFAEATDCDPVAILNTVALRSSDFAVRAADNKLMTILIMMLNDLEEELSSDMEYLNVRALIGAVDKLGKELVDYVRRRDQFAERWLEEKTPKVDGASFRRRFKGD